VTRERLPDRRASIVFGFEHLTQSGAIFDYVARVGFYPDGRPGEVFVDGRKLTTQADIEAHDAAIILSFALQHGASLDEVGAALLRGESGEPHGVMGALVDAIKREGANRGPDLTPPEPPPVPDAPAPSAEAVA
jgi:hypothetical protein